MPDNQALSLSGIQKVYDANTEAEVVALDGVTFSVTKGEMIAITGASGSGKSTLLHVLGLLDKPTAGVYTINGKNVEDVSAGEAARKRNEEIGFVFQAFNLLKRTSVYRNIELPLLYSRKIKRSERKERITKVLKQVGLLDRIKSKTNELSGGQQQRVAIARALVTEPSFLLADEPTGNLDTKRGMEVMDILVQLNKEEKTTIIVVTHDPEIAALAGRIISFRDGKIIEDKIT